MQRAGMDSLDQPSQLVVHVTIRSIAGLDDPGWKRSSGRRQIAGDLPRIGEGEPWTVGMRA